MTLAADLVTLSRLGVSTAGLHDGAFAYSGTRTHDAAVLHNGTARYDGAQHHTSPPWVGVQLQTAITMAAALASESTHSAPLSALTLLAANLVATSAADGAASTAIRLAADPTSWSDVGTALNAQILAAAAHSGESAVSAGLVTDIRAAATLAAESAIGAPLQTAITMGASASADASASAGLQTAITMAAAPSAQADVAASLDARITMAGAMAAQADGAAALDARITMRAQLHGYSVRHDGAICYDGTQRYDAAPNDAPPSLVTDIRMAAALACDSAMAATTLDFYRPLASDQAAQSAIGADLLTALHVAAGMAAQASASADLDARITPAADLAASTAADAWMATAIRMAADLASASTASAPSLETLRPIAADLAATSSTGPALDARITMATALAATSTWQPMDVGGWPTFRADLVNAAEAFADLMARIQLGATVNAESFKQGELRTVSWNYPPGRILSVNKTDPVNIALVATVSPAAGALVYTVVEHNLPPSMAVAVTGAGVTITGDASQAAPVGTIYYRDGVAYQQAVHPDSVPVGAGVYEWLAYPEAEAAHIIVVRVTDGAITHTRAFEIGVPNDFAAHRDALLDLLERVDP